MQWISGKICLIGGFTEYMGLMTGFNNLLLIITAVYGASYLLTLAAGRRG